MAQNKSEKFFAAKRIQWESLGYLIKKVQSTSPAGLSEDEVKAFPRLYRLITTDLAEARMLKLAPDVLRYLNDMVGQAHKMLYQMPPLKQAAVGRFFTKTMPYSVLKNWLAVTIAGFLFFGSYFVTFYMVNNDPTLAFLMVPADILSEMELSYSTANDGRPFAKNSYATSFYISNNLSVSFLCFVSGVLLGIGSILLLLYNGIYIGAVAGYICAMGHSENFYNFVTAHAALELIGICIAGGAGLTLGHTILKAGRFRRWDTLAIARDNIFTLVGAASMLIFFAAFVEGFISPSALPYSLKVSLFGVSFSLILLYFLVLPGWIRKQ